MENNNSGAVRVWENRRKTFRQFVLSVDSMMPFESDFAAIDSERVRFFDGKPTFARCPDGVARWIGDEVGSWKYGAFSNLKEYFNISDFIVNDTFMFSRTLVEI